jgi:uncharacterized membrane protein
MPPKKKTAQKSSSEVSQEVSDPDRPGLDRLIFFSDGVFAIAATLLMLEIRLPSGADAFNNQELATSLIGTWHKYLAYMISFLVIGSFWISHHRKFRLIKRYDGGLMMLNLLLMMMIAFIPFPSAVISENGNRTATIFYALVMMTAGLIVTGLWWHAVRNNHLIDPRVSKKRRWLEAAAPLATVGIFLVSIGIAFLDENLARLSWVLILPASLIVNRGKSDA